MTSTYGATTVHGTVAPGFERLRDELGAAPSEGPAQLAAFVDGVLVADLWTGGPDDGDLVSPVFSCTKGLVHLVVAALVQDGVLDPDAAVADCWPEFAAAGKAATTVRQLLTHEAGLVGVPGGFTLDELADDRHVAERLAGLPPCWDPGTAFGYHALTLGALASELVQRASGTTVVEHLASRVPAVPGAHAFIGVPVELDHLVRPVLPVLPGGGAPTLPPGASAHLRALAFNQSGPEPTDLVEHGNSDAVRRRGAASAGGIANARGLAAHYAAFVTGVDGRPPQLRSETVARFARPLHRGTDAVTGRTDRFALGFEATSLKYDGLLGPDAIGHSGAGGCEAFADPGTGIAYAYVRRRMARSRGGEAPENHQLVRALVRAVAPLRDREDGSHE